MYAAVTWLILIVLLVIIEIATLGLTTIWFAGGALVAFIANLCGANLPIQIILFTLVSFAMLFATRPIAIRYINKDRIKTNAESLIGQNATVQEDIDNMKAMGQVIVNGQEWTARSTEDAVLIAVGSTVVIDAIQGVKLIVKKVN
ncbi:MAG: NfeD family protein [Lachnospiraceae bacterium]